MKWEYVIIATNILAVDYGHQLDDLGEQGWELVAVTNNKMYFKRRRTQTVKRMVGRRVVETDG